LALGGHTTDICAGIHWSPGLPSVSPGTLHRRTLHQVQLKFWFCGREPASNSAGKKIVCQLQIT